MGILRVDDRSAPLRLASIVDPKRLDDAVHPAVHPRALRKLIDIPQRFFAGGLNQIVGILLIARKTTGKPPELRHKRHQIAAKSVGHATFSFSWGGNPKENAQGCNLFPETSQKTQPPAERPRHPPPRRIAGPPDHRQDTTS
jgi:hypothetical protein